MRGEIRIAIRMIRGGFITFEAPRLLDRVKPDARFLSDVHEVTDNSQAKPPGCWEL
jgi:hypothetical protein